MDNNTNDTLKSTGRRLLSFMDASPVNFLAAQSVIYELQRHGFEELSTRAAWTINPGDRRYIVVNDSAVFAFIAGNGAPEKGFHIIAAHSDSPGFRLKPHCEIDGEGGIVRLNTEVYGGPILYTWFDRPLSLAGRVILRSYDPINPRRVTVRFDRPLLTIPHLAIHFNRAVNDGNKLSKQKDMLPVMALGMPQAGDAVRKLVAEKIGCDTAEIIDYDLSLYDTTPACMVGMQDEMVSSGRLDDLSMVHAGLEALCAATATDSETTRVLAVFDNEETGSGTKQGAGSPVLEYILRRLNACLGGSGDSFERAVASSFLISADNAHGFHPNYPEKYDPVNHPILGGGPCIKINANCKYMTDADSAAVFAELCRRAKVPFQYFVNHSDSAGGSTLGNILTGQMPMRGVDMGAPVWAMHSVRETASIADHLYTIRAFKEFFSL